MDFTLSPSIEDGTCPHLAVLLRTASELFPALASFYALGAKRGGFLAHRSIQGRATEDRERLSAAGLDVAALEGTQQLVIVDFDPDEPPEDSPQPWQDVLDRSLSGGFSAMWYSRFATGPGAEQFSKALPFERAWGRCFAGQHVVTLCPYIVGELNGSETLRRLGEVSRVHDGVLLAGEDGFALVRRAAQ